MFSISLGIVPFRQLEEIFLNDTPTIDVHAADSGSSEAGKIELAYLLNLLRFKQDLDSKERQVYYGKRIADREPNNDLIIPHEKGYYFIYDHISQGSVYATLLKPLSKSSDDFIPMVLFRGTRVNFSASGSLATIKAALYDDQASYTYTKFLRKFNHFVNPPSSFHSNSRQRKRAGFIEHDESFAVCGMSLGGGHAALTASYFPSRVSVIELTAPIGLLSKYLKSYANVINAYADSEGFVRPTIVRIVDEHDTVTHLGNGHLGYGCLKHVKYTLHCAVSKGTATKYSDNPSGFWQGHFNNEHTKLPTFMLNTRIGGLITLLQGLCGKHTYNPYSDNNNPDYFSLSNDQSNECVIKEGDLIHHDDVRYYVEFGRRSAGQLLSGGVSTMFAAIAAISVLSLLSLALTGIIPTLLAPVGISLFLIAATTLSLAIATATLAILMSPTAPIQETEVESHEEILPYSIL